MSRDRASAGDLLLDPVVCASFALLVFPFAVGVVDARLWTPLALPGYVLFVLMTVVGDVLPVVRSFGFRLYWVPFLLVCYGVSIAVAVGYAAIRR
jgi:hypothetical protein